MLMKRVVAWVQEELHDVLKDKRDPATLIFERFLGSPTSSAHELRPLEMPADTQKNAAMTSYKAPWETAFAQASLASNGLYEAAVNIMWLNPFPSGVEAQVVAGTPLRGHR